MAKAFGGGSFGKVPKTTGKLGSGVPGDFSRARMTEAQGQKTTSNAGKPIEGSKNPTSQKVNVATGDNLLMPTDHPASTTTRTVKATSGF